MAKYRKVDPKIWNDGKFCALSDNGKLAFLFLLTHPHMTSLGAMRASLPGLAAELGWTPKAFTEAFQEALSKGMVRHDEKACFVWLPRFLKYNPPESPNVVRSWSNAHDMIPECDLKWQLYQQVKDYAEGLPEGFAKALPEDFAKSMPNQEQEQEQEQEGTTYPNSSEVASDSERVVVVFPTVGGKQSEWALTESHADQLSEAFPGLDIPGEARKALGWIMANPKKAKTPSGMPKFLFGWMERNQNRGRGSPSTKPQRKSFDLEAWAKAGTDDSK